MFGVPISPFTTQGSTIITWTYNDGNGNIKTQTLTLTAPSISGGSLKAYISTINTVANATDNIAITSCPDDVNPIAMNLSSETGTIVRWEKFEAGDTAWSAIANTSNITPTLILVILNQLCLGTYSSRQLYRVFKYRKCTYYPTRCSTNFRSKYFNICLNDQVTLVARSGYTSTVNVGDGVIIILVNSRQMGSHTMEN
jgi:hypothetical protein